MGLWNQSVFDPIFASVLLRTGRTVSNQERLYGIGTRFWRYLVVKYSARPSAKRKAQGAGRFPLCASRLAPRALRLALSALTWRLQVEPWKFAAGGWSGNRASSCGAGSPGSDRTAGWTLPAAVRPGPP